MIKQVKSGYLLHHKSKHSNNNSTLESYLWDNRVRHDFWKAQKFQRWPAFLVLLHRETWCKRAEPNPLGSYATLFYLSPFYWIFLTIFFNWLMCYEIMTGSFLFQSFVLFNFVFMIWLWYPAHWARNWWVFQEFWVFPCNLIFLLRV